MGLDIRDRLAREEPLLFDGAMGTMLYARGVTTNANYEELNVTRPELVRSIHAAYAAAGAEVLTTNTYCANRTKMARYHLAERLDEINRAAVALAREAAGPDRWVAGSMGPLSIRIEPYGPTSVDEARDLFAEQARALVAGGVDLIILETFSDPNEIHQAIRAVREVAPDCPILAQMTVQDDGATVFGSAPEVFGPLLQRWGADAVGLNCSVGPNAMLAAVERLAGAVSLPVSAMPNAGSPTTVEGRKMYLCSPEYVAKYARHYLQVGVRILGGCCGTTPEHIAAVAGAIRSVVPRRGAVEASPSESPAAAKGPGRHEVKVPLAARSRFAARLAAGEFVATVELVPPRGADASRLVERARKLAEAGFHAVNLPDGPRAQCRMSAVAAAVLIERETGLETIPHYCCRDRNLLGMQSDLLGASALGLRNVLLVTGDPPKMGPYPDSTAVFDVDAIGLTNLVHRFNCGEDLGGNPIGSSTAFCVGVGVNPSAVNVEEELRRFYWKIDAGADFAMTQPVFDVAVLKSFLEKVTPHPVPIVVGIWPLVSLANAEFLRNEVPGLHIPDDVLRRMERAQREGGKEGALAEGVAIARETLAEVRPLVAGVQLAAPMGRIAMALRVLEGIHELEGTLPED